MLPVLGWQIAQDICGLSCGSGTILCCLVIMLTQPQTGQYATYTVCQRHGMDLDSAFRSELLTIIVDPQHQQCQRCTKQFVPTDAATDASGNQSELHLHPANVKHNRLRMHRHVHF